MFVRFQFFLLLSNFFQSWFEIKIALFQGKIARNLFLSQIETLFPIIAGNLETLFIFSHRMLRKLLSTQALKCTSFPKAKLQYITRKVSIYPISLIFSYFTF